MMKRLFAILLAAVSLAAFVSCTEEKATDSTPVYSNPIAKLRADPWVYKHTDGYYYFTATYNSASLTGFDRIIMRRSKTISGLHSATETAIWTAPDTTVGAYAYIWAPELHYIDGVWYIYYTASTSSSYVWTVRQFVMKCTDANPITGTWTQVGRLASTTINTFAVDGTVFELNDQLYYVWSQYDYTHDVTGDGTTDTAACLYIAKMTDPVTVDETEVTEISVPTYSWEMQTVYVNEAPAILIRNGKVFIVYSASACDQTYCLGMLTADQTSDLLDAASWTKSAEPVFSSSETNSAYGPGHCSFTTDGDYDVIVYHARSYTGVYTTASLSSVTTSSNALADPFRSTRAKVFTWNADGTPNFGEPE